jgi:hypothetical protein
MANFPLRRYCGNGETIRRDEIVVRKLQRLPAPHFIFVAARSCERSTGTRTIHRRLAAR